jgi:hypothetical protein
MPPWAGEPSNTDILMSLLSVQRFFSWVRKVHVVVDEQSFPLDFLEPDFSSKVVLHDLATFMPRALLPTFNSLSITAFLHRLPDFTESFVYLNDDMMFARAITPDNFFDKHNHTMAPMFSPEGHIQRHGGDMMTLPPEVLDTVPYLFPDINAAHMLPSTLGTACPGSTPTRRAC